MTGDHHTHFHYREKKERRTQIESGKYSAGRVRYPASEDQTENEVSGRLASLKHFPLGRRNY